MDVGRWYRDNSGQEFRFIGNIDETNTIGLFSTGQGTIEKPLSDFEDMPKERKLFKFFGKGGITANDLLEARSFFGEEEWKKLKREDRIKSARYLKRTGKIGYKKGGKLPEPEESQEYYASMQYSEGGRTGGEYEEKDLLAQKIFDIEYFNWLGFWEQFHLVQKYNLDKNIITKTNYSNGGEIASIKKGISFYKRKAKKGDKNAKRNLELLQGILERKQNPIVRTQFEEEEFEYEDGGKVRSKYNSGLKEDFLEDMQELHTDIKEITLRDGSKISQDELRQAHRFDNGGEMDSDDDDIDYNSISDLQSERNRLVRWENQYGKGVDYKIKQLEERIKFLKSKEMASGGFTSSYSGTPNRRRVTMADGGDLDTFSNIFKKFGFSERKQSYGLKKFYLSHNGVSYYGTVDKQGYNRPVLLEKIHTASSKNDYKYATTLYEGLSVRKLIEKLKELALEEKMAKGGKIAKRYTVNVYYGGEMEDDQFHTDSLSEAKRLSQRGEHSEIYDNSKKQFIEFANGGSIRENVYELILKNPNGGMTRKVILMANSKDEASNKALGLREFKGMGWVVKSVNEDKYAKGGKLVGKQKNLDLNKNGKLDSEDFKMLRRRKMSKGGTLDYSKISSVEVEDIFMYDAPDFVDAYISYAEYDGEPMTDEQLEELNQDGDFVYDSVQRHLYAKGGKVGFQDKANAIADSLEGKKVASKYRKQYGAKYDRSEAEMAGKRIAGAMRKKYGI